MPLPILQGGRELSPDDLIRLYYRTEVHWTRHLADEAALDAGTAFTNPSLPRVHDANRVLDAAVPEGSSAEETFREIEAHFAAQGTHCWKIAPNPAAPRERTEPLVRHLEAAGWERSSGDVLYLAGAPAGPIKEVGGLTIIPARASYRHARALAEEGGRVYNEPEQLAEASLLHLDDPHYDALLALRDGTAVGCIGVLAVGEIGRIDDVYVSEGHRRQGIGRTLMSRALEICARSLFKHVLLYVDPTNEAAMKLYRGSGFKTIGTYTTYHAP